MEKFNPTNDQITVAQELFATMALRIMAKEAFDSFEKQLINTGQYHYSNRYYEDERLRKVYQELPADRIIRDPREAHMIEGIEYLHDETRYPYSDCAKYYSELERLASDAGWINGQNAFCVIDNRVNQLENQFITVTEPIHHMSVEMVSGSLNNRRKLIELSLKLFAGTVKNSNLETIKRKVYHEHYNILLMPKYSVLRQMFAKP